jgi:hypothetical protein
MSTLEVKAIQAPTGYDLDMPAGAILQVVNANTSSNVTVAGGFADIGLSASITPKFASSKIYIQASVACLMDGNSSSHEGFGIKILRDSTQIYADQQEYSVYTAIVTRLLTPYMVMDTPNSTSALTYKLQATTYLDRGVAFQSGNTSFITLMEVAG